MVRRQSIIKRGRDYTRAARNLVLLQAVALGLSACSLLPGHSDALRQRVADGQAQLQESGWATMAARHCYLDTTGPNDNLFPDYVVCFTIPAGTEWRPIPLSLRAACALYGPPEHLRSQVPLHSDSYSPAGHEICVVSGWRSNARAGYGHHNPQEYADELRLQYRPQ